MYTKRTSLDYLFPKCQNWAKKSVYRSRTIDINKYKNPFKLKWVSEYLYTYIQYTQNNNIGCCIHIFPILGAVLLCTWMHDRYIINHSEHISLSIFLHYWKKGKVPFDDWFGNK